jgi:RNA polymerase sigma factor (sigma-70 family)
MEHADPTLEILLAESGWLRRLVARLVRDPADADDITQETWARALVSPPADISSPRAWLAQVSRNVLRMRSRAEIRRLKYEAAAAADVEANDTTTEAAVQRLEFQRVLVELVSAMQEPLRSTVVMRYFEELNSAQIAERMAVAPGTVRARLSLALGLLRAALDEQCSGNRKHWMAMVGPAMVPRVGTATKGIGSGFVKGMALSLVGLLLVLAWRTTHQRQQSGPTDFTTSAQSPVSMPAKTTLKVEPQFKPPSLDYTAVLPSAETDRSGKQRLARCYRDIHDLRRKIEETEPAAIRVMMPDLVYGMGSANPEAESAMAPVIERIMKGSHESAVPYTLDCRTHGCRLLIGEPRDTPTERINDWMMGLQQDDEIRLRSAGVGFFGSGETRDPITDERLNRKTVFLKLHHPSGAKGKSISLPPWPELPFAANDCLTMAAELQTRLQRATDNVRRYQPVSKRFSAGTVQPELAATLRHIIAETFPDEARQASITVECRDHVCRFDGPEQGFEWRTSLQNSKAFQERMISRHSGGVGALLVVVKSENELVATRQIDASIDETMASPLARACKRMYPDPGRLFVQFQNPTLDVVLAGPAAGTAYGRCVAPLVTPIAQSVARDLLGDAWIFYQRELR